MNAALRNFVKFKTNENENEEVNFVVETDCPIEESKKGSKISRLPINLLNSPMSVKNIKSTCTL